ncbi:MAG: PorP/SprF family type IX secretion system membrane protein [Saprospiraceae bacterium]|nr:PorP/SprF family type IX secretion system membrane protein [Saprospiraceae bacterium]MCB9324739.1 PorP/SprF family type IX secretion system membrane protein [Lewinellaceae bacterium]
MSKKILTILIVLLPLLSFSQQLPERSVFDETNFLWNPAMTAPWEYWEMGATYRQSWVGFEDAPRTATLNMQYPMIKENMAMGGFFLHDDISPLKINTFAMTYAYKLRLGGKQQLSLGVMGIMNHFLVNGLEVVVNDDDDELLPGPEGNLLSPNVGFGIFYINNTGGNFEGNSFYAGLAANQLLSTDIVFKEFGSPGNFKRAFHGNAVLGYRSISGDILIEPALWINFSTPGITDANFCLKFEKRESFWAGLNLSFNQTLSFQVGYILTKGIVKDGSLRVGLAGSYNLGPFAKARGIGYEFYVAYRFEL